MRTHAHTQADADAHTRMRTRTCRQSSWPPTDAVPSSLSSSLPPVSSSLLCPDIMESLRRWPRRLTGASPRLHRGRASVGGVGGGREVPPCVLRSSSLTVDTQTQGKGAVESEPGIRKRPFSGWQPQPPPSRHGPTPTDPPARHGATTRRQCYRMPSWGDACACTTTRALQGRTGTSLTRMRPAPSSTTL